MAKKLRVLAICSSGGHWVQMRRISSAFDGAEVIYAAPLEPAPKGISGQFIKIPDANRWGKIRLIYMALRVSLLVLWLRPTHVISTGAAPGYIAIRAGKLVGAKSLWLDSIANAEVLSLSGEKAGKHVDVWLTQWPHLESTNGPKYRGSVL